MRGRCPERSGAAEWTPRGQAAVRVRERERQRNKIDPLEERPRKRPNKKAFKRVREGGVRVPILLPQSVLPSSLFARRSWEFAVVGLGRRREEK